MCTIMGTSQGVAGRFWYFWSWKWEVTAALCLEWVLSWMQWWSVIIRLELHDIFSLQWFAISIHMQPHQCHWVSLWLKPICIHSPWCVGCAKLVQHRTFIQSLQKQPTTAIEKFVESTHLRLLQRCNVAFVRKSRTPFGPKIGTEMVQNPLEGEELFWATRWSDVPGKSHEMDVKKKGGCAKVWWRNWKGKIPNFARKNLQLPVRCWKQRVDSSFYYY